MNRLGNCYPYYKNLLIREIFKNKEDWNTQMIDDHYIRRRYASLMKNRWAIPPADIIGDVAEATRILRERGEFINEDVDQHLYNVKWNKNKQSKEKKVAKRIEKRVLEIEYTVSSSREDTVDVGITFQSHRGDDFTPEGRMFVATDGFALYSVYRPAMENSNGFYVRGSSTPKDYNRVLVKKENLSRLICAVSEYNEEFSVNDYSGQVKQVAKNLLDHIYETKNRLDALSTRLHDVTDVDELMKHKEELMKIMLAIPMSNKHCVYCEINEDGNGNFNCADCDYAHIHGQCSLPASKYRKMDALVNKLREEINGYAD